MKITLSRSQLLKPLQRVVGVVERRQTLPILSNVLLRTESDSLSLLGTDLEVELVAHVNLDGITMKGETTLPARKLMDITRSLPDSAEIALTIDQQQAVLKSGRSRFTLSTLPSGDFPRIDEGPSDTEFAIPSKHLSHLLDRTAFAGASSSYPAVRLLYW